MSLINKVNALLCSRYADGGRGPVDFDCWGLVRAARTEIYDKPLLPEFAGALRRNREKFNGAYYEQSSRMKKVEARPGSIAAVMRGDICVHVALITHDIAGLSGVLYALDTNPKTGAVYRTLSQFEREIYGKKIIYYDD